MTVPAVSPAAVALLSSLVVAGYAVTANGREHSHSVAEAASCVRVCVLVEIFFSPAVACVAASHWARAFGTRRPGRLRYHRRCMNRSFWQERAAMVTCPISTP